MEPTDRAPSHGPSPGFPGIAPPVSQMDIIMETNDEIRDADPTLPPSLPDITPPLSRADTIDETYQMDVNNLEDKQLNEDELFAVSKEDVLALNPLTPSVQPPPQPQFLEDLIYYWYGYCLDEEPYQGHKLAFEKSFNPFNYWVTVCRAVGGQGLSSSEKNHAPIIDFLVALLGSRQPYHEVPGKYWDISAGNSEPLTSFSPIHLCIEVKKFCDFTLCLLHSRGQVPTTDWCIAVEPMTSLECIRHCLGPSLIDVAEFLLKNGTPFHTLAPSSKLPLEQAPATSPHLSLGCHPHRYKFDLADFAAYETRRESFLLAQPQGRRALCYGGIVAHLARETLPDSAVFTGPSYKACQETLEEGGDLLVDDRLSDRDLDLICGTYEVETGLGGMHDFATHFCNELMYLSSRSNCNAVLVPEDKCLGKCWP